MPTVAASVVAHSTNLEHLPRSIRRIMGRLLSALAISRFPSRRLHSAYWHPPPGEDTSQACQPNTGTVPAAYGTRPDGDAQLVAHTQHSPLPILHGPTDEVTVQGADTLVSKSPAAQLQVAPHTATVWAAAHTQHSPLPIVQLPVNDCTA